MSINDAIAPSGWRWATLGDVVDRIEAGRSPKTLERPARGAELGVLKVSAVTLGHLRPDQNKALLPGYNPGGCPSVRRGDLLFSRANTTELVGAVAISEDDYPRLLLSDKTLRIVLREDWADPRFILYALRSYRVRGYLESVASGTSGSMRNISQGKLLATKLLLPPLPEQRRIAAILDKADAIRRKRQQAIQLTEALLRSVFLDMFGDPVTNPKGWPSSPLGELVVHGPQNGLYRPAKDYGRGRPIVRIDSFYDGELLGLARLKRAEMPRSDVAVFGLEPGDVLVNRVNSLNFLGKSAIVRDLLEPTVFECNIMRIRLDTRCIEPDYLVSQLGHAYVRRQVLRKARNAVNQSSINQHDVATLVVRVPPVALQRAFVALKLRCRCSLQSQLNLRSWSAALVTALRKVVFVTPEPGACFTSIEGC